MTAASVHELKPCFCALMQSRCSGTACLEVKEGEDELLHLRS